MAQVTLYLDQETEDRLRQAAQAAGVSRSKWVAGLIRERTAQEWPVSVLRLAGAWKDFPELDELRRGPDDLPREPL